MTERRFTLLVPHETHRKLKILSAEANQSMTKIVVALIDEKYVGLKKGSQFLLPQKEPKFFYSK